MLNAETIWRYPPALPVLKSDEVHVWCAVLDQPARAFRECEQTLSSDEHVRALQIPSLLYRHRFIAARGLMRMILSRYVGAAPQNLFFSYSRRGKPFLSPESGGGWIDFSLTYSNSLALCAVTCKREIGIDLEHLRQIEKAALIASQFFSARENRDLRRLAPELRLEAFLNCWTRKGAYFKALGLGISECAAQVEVSLKPNHPSCLLSIAGDKDSAAHWIIRSLSPAPGYVGALAVYGPIVKIRCWQWPGNAEAIFPAFYRSALGSQLN